MKFYSFHKRHIQSDKSEMHWFTNKAEAEKKLREEVKNNPYEEYVTRHCPVSRYEYILSDSVACFDIPTMSKKGLLRFLQQHVNIENNQHFPLEITQ